MKSAVRKLIEEAEKTPPEKRIGFLKKLADGTRFHGEDSKTVHWLCVAAVKQTGGQRPAAKLLGCNYTRVAREWKKHNEKIKEDEKYRAEEQRFDTQILTVINEGVESLLDRFLALTTDALEAAISKVPDMTGPQAAGVAKIALEKAVQLAKQDMDKVRARSERLRSNDELRDEVYSQADLLERMKVVSTKNG